MGIAPTGKGVTLTTIVISRIANGEFQEDWESMDGIYVWQQLMFAGFKHPPLDPGHLWPQATNMADWPIWELRL